MYSNFVLRRLISLQMMFPIKKKKKAPIHLYFGCTKKFLTKILKLVQNQASIYNFVFSFHFFQSSRIQEGTCLSYFTLFNESYNCAKPTAFRTHAYQKKSGCKI